MKQILGKYNILFHSVLLTFLLLIGCKKESTVLIENNVAPGQTLTSTIKVKNYINRIYVDLLGRAPLDQEMEEELDNLQSNNLSEEARENLINKLQTSSFSINGAATYKEEYYQQIYNLAKARCLESASDLEIQDEITSGSPPEVILRILDVLYIPEALLGDTINIRQIFERMIYNKVYDKINMNTFNLIRASFETLLWRYPTETEFQSAFDMIEDESTQTLFEEQGSSRRDYTNLIINSREMYEGMVNWSFRQLLNREPNTDETLALLLPYLQDDNFRRVQLLIMKSDEYAGF